jgi:hypothetical protein
MRRRDFIAGLGGTPCHRRRGDRVNGGFGSKAAVLRGSPASVLLRCGERPRIGAPRATKGWGNPRPSRRSARRRESYQCFVLDCRFRRQHQQCRLVPRTLNRVPHQCGKSGVVPPSPGEIGHYHPRGGMGVRIDSATCQGYAIPPHYSSLLGKFIVHGKTRGEAQPCERVMARPNCAATPCRRLSCVHSATPVISRTAASKWTSTYPTPRPSSACRSMKCSTSASVAMPA